MTYVLDSSVTLKWVLNEKDTLKALRLRSEFLLAAHELIAPDLFPVECGHALTRAERRKLIGVGEADPLLLDILTTPPQFHSHRHLLRNALAISSATRQGVYDCLYVALAEQEQCDLVTADDKLIKNLGPTFSFIRSLASLP